MRKKTRKVLLVTIWLIQITSHLHTLPCSRLCNRFTNQLKIKILPFSQRSKQPYGIFHIDYSITLIITGLCREKMIPTQILYRKSFLMHFFFFPQAKELQKTSIIKQFYKWHFWLHQRIRDGSHVFSLIGQQQISFIMQPFLWIKNS